MENALWDFIHSFKNIRKLTRSLRSVVRFLIPWITIHADTPQLVNKNRARAFSME